MKIELDPKERDLLVSEIEHILPELGGTIASGLRKELWEELRREKLMLLGILDKLKLAA